MHPSDEIESASAFSDPLYQSLRDILDEAFLQAATGKGRQRHGGEGIGFEDQPMQAISRLLRSPDGLAYQAIKKIQEAMRMEPEARDRELCGAINYVAGIILYCRLEERRRGAKLDDLMGIERTPPIGKAHLSASALERAADATSRRNGARR